MLAPANPELALVAGPHFFSSTDITADFTMSLRWPIDLSGSRQARKALAEESVRGADTEVCLMGENGFFHAEWSNAQPYQPALA